MKYLRYVLVWLTLLLSPALFAQEQRFPMPEFETGYSQPETVEPGPEALFMDYFDVFVLIAALILTTWFVLKRRSRKGVLWTSVCSLIYFGFIRGGCVCAVGSLQNVVQAIADKTYILPLTTLLFFLIPIIFTLFFGRTFCAGVCPLGALQDLIAFRPIELPKWLQKTLGIIPYLYLGLAVLYAATKSDFLICRYDPFVGLFRFDAQFSMLVLGGLFLLIGVFVARPYCRFLCPYGVILGWASKFSKKHISITASECIHCKLCTNSCPFGVINEPLEPEAHRRSEIKSLAKYLVIIPFWILLGAFAGIAMHTTLAKFNSTVYLADQIVEHPEVLDDPDNLDVQTFLEKEQSIDALIAESQEIISQFYWGSLILGAFMGLIIGLTLVGLSTYRQRRIYEPDKTHCFSCGRCIDFCPVKQGLDPEAVRKNLEATEKI